MLSGTIILILFGLTFNFVKCQDVAVEAGAAAAIVVLRAQIEANYADLQAARQAIIDEAQNSARDAAAQAARDRGDEEDAANGVGEAAAVAADLAARRAILNAIESAGNNVDVEEAVNAAIVAAEDIAAGDPEMAAEQPAQQPAEQQGQGQAQGQVQNQGQGQAQPVAQQAQPQPAVQQGQAQGQAQPAAQQGQEQGRQPNVQERQNVRDRHTIRVGCNFSGRGDFSIPPFAGDANNRMCSVELKNDPDIFLYVCDGVSDPPHCPEDVIDATDGVVKLSNYFTAAVVNDQTESYGPPGPVFVGITGKPEKKLNGKCTCTRNNIMYEMTITSSAHSIRVIGVLLVTIFYTIYNV